MHVTNESAGAIAGGMEDAPAMHTLRELWGSTVGRKALAAVSGLLLWIWVTLHVLGNLTLFSGPAAADGYAAVLHRAPGWLWAARVGLAAAAAVHVAAVASLARAGRAARPRHEARAARRASTAAARSMRVGGALLLAFVGYHVAHLTLGLAHPGFRPGHVYDNVVGGLRTPWIAGVYAAAAALLGLHLFHGLWAAVRSLGVRPDAAAGSRRPAVALLSAAVAAGFAAIPIAVLAGWLR
jgi:succinate dehydrogenase / fumarate reductase cytochrome b subunit